MTVREYRKGDWVGVADLWRRNPSREFPLLGLDPDAVGIVLRKTESLGIRFVLRLARWVGRPPVVVLVVDVGGRVMGTTLLSFNPENAYVSGVVVDASLRRQGHAQAMLRVCDDLCRRYHRPYVVLDVLVGNDPAIRLYDRWGYQRLRDLVWLARDFGPGAPIPALSATTRVRPSRPSDGPTLAEMDNALMPPEVRKIVPHHPSDFREPRVARGLLDSEVKEWVAEVDGRPAGFVRATVSHLMEAANLSSLVLDGGVPGPVARDLLVTALGWVEAKRVPRVLTEVPEHEWRMRPLFDELGFVEHFRSHTMVHRLAV